MSRTKTSYTTLVTVNISDLRNSVDLYCANQGTTMTALLEDNDVSSSFFKTAILKFNKETGKNDNKVYGITRMSRLDRICDLIDVKAKDYIVDEQAENRADNSDTECDEVSCSEMLNQINENVCDLRNVMLQVVEQLKKFNE